MSRKSRKRQTKRFESTARINHLRITFPHIDDRVCQCRRQLVSYPRSRQSNSRYAKLIADYHDRRSSTTRHRQREIGYLVRTVPISFHPLNKSNAAKLSVTKYSILKCSDVHYVEKVSSVPDDTPVDSCDHQPCQNNGVCSVLDDQHYCQCNGNWRGKSSCQYLTLFELNLLHVVFCVELQRNKSYTLLFSST